MAQQLEAVQQRAAAKEANSRKYKDAVRAFKVRACTLVCRAADASGTVPIAQG
jgi:hypothetical protein